MTSRALLPLLALPFLQGCATHFLHEKILPRGESAEARDELRWTTSAGPRVLDCPFLGRDGNRPRWLYQLRGGDTPLYLVLDTTYWQSNYIVDTLPTGAWTKEPSAPALQLVVADAALPVGFQPTTSPQGDPTRALVLLNTPSYVRKQTPVGTFEGGQGQVCVYFTAPGETRNRCRGIQTSVASSWTFRPERGLYALSGAIDLALSPAYLVVGIVCLPWFLSGAWMPQIRY